MIDTILYVALGISFLALAIQTFRFFDVGGNVWTLRHGPANYRKKWRRWFAIFPLMAGENYGNRRLAWLCFVEWRLTPVYDGEVYTYRFPKMKH